MLVKIERVTNGYVVDVDGVRSVYRTKGAVGNHVREQLTKPTYGIKAAMESAPDTPPAVGGFKIGDRVKLRNGKIHVVIGRQDQTCIEEPMIDGNYYEAHTGLCKYNKRGRQHLEVVEILP